MVTPWWCVCLQIYNMLFYKVFRVETRVDQGSFVPGSAEGDSSDLSLRWTESLRAKATIRSHWFGRLSLELSPEWFRWSGIYDPTLYDRMLEVFSKTDRDLLDSAVAIWLEISRDWPTKMPLYNYRILTHTQIESVALESAINFVNRFLDLKRIWINEPVQDIERFA